MFWYKHLPASVAVGFARLTRQLENVPRFGAWRVYILYPQEKVYENLFFYPLPYLGVCLRLCGHLTARVSCPIRLLFSDALCS